MSDQTTQQQGEHTGNGQQQRQKRPYTKKAGKKAGPQKHARTALPAGSPSQPAPQMRAAPQSSAAKHPLINGLFASFPDGADIKKFRSWLEAAAICGKVACGFEGDLVISERAAAKA